VHVRLRLHPSRAATLLVLYAGSLLFVQFGAVQGFELSVDAVGTLGGALVFWAFALHRSRLPPDEVGPTSYGPLVYVLAVLCLVLTVTTVGLALAHSTGG